MPGDVPDGRPPATPEGLNEAFAVDFTERVMEIKERVVGERPHICEFFFFPLLAHKVWWERGRGRPLLMIMGV